jgi:hypothetical protein
LFGAEKNNLFQKCVPNLPKGEMKHEEIQEKTAKAYERMKQRAHDRKNKRKHGNATWKPRVPDKVLVRTQPSSDAIAGVTAKFIRPFQGPYVITGEVSDRNGKIKGQFSLKSITVYKEANDVI